MTTNVRNNLFRRWLVPAVTALSLIAAGPALAIDKLKIMVPAAPGGGWDLTGRTLQQAMQAHDIVKNIQIDNKGGAAGTIGLAQFVNSSKGDPNAMIVSGFIMVGGIIFNKSPVSMSQITPLARLTGEYDVIAVAANSPIKSMKDLVEKLKANPAGVTWGGGSAGGIDHITAAMIAQHAGVDASKLNYIAFPGGGGEAQTAILGGHVTVGVNGYSELAGQIASGKMRALAITSGQRLPGVAIPTLKEQGIDVEIANWRGVFGAPGITEAQRQELITVIDKTVKSPTWQEALKKHHWADLHLSGDAFKAFVDSEVKRTEKVLTSLGMVK